MRITSAILIVFLGTLMGIAHGQISPTATLDLESNASQIYIHSTTGIPIFQTDVGYVAVHPTKQEILWKTDRTGLATFTEILGDESDELKDYFELPASLLAYVGSSIVNVVSGKIVVDGVKEEVRGLSAFTLFPELDLLTVKLYVKGGYKIYGIDPFESELKWSTLLDESSGLGQALAESESSSDVYKRTVKPFVSANGNLIFSHRKLLASVNPKEGKLNWTVKADAGQVLFSKDNKYLAYAENGGGLMPSIDLSDPTGQSVKLGKKVNVIDAASGKDVWKKEVKMDGNVRFMKPYDGGFLVVHDNGVNIYDFNSEKGEPRWKKGINQNGVYDVLPEEGGLMVYFKRKRQLFSPEDGKEMWKKAEKLDYDVEQYSISEQASEETTSNYAISIADTYIRVTNKTNNRSARLNSDFFLEDVEANKVIAVGIANREGTTIGAPQYTVNILDLNNFTIIDDIISQKQGLHTIDKVASGYFVFGDRGFQLLTDKNGSIEVLKEEHFPLPGAFTNELTRIGIGISGAAMMASTTSNYVVKSGPDGFQNYQNKMNTIDELGASGINYFIPEEISSVDNNFAYFFSRDDDKKLALIQIEKNTGEEKARYLFDDKSPVYSVDYLNGKLYYINDTTLKIFELDQ